MDTNPVRLNFFNAAELVDYIRWIFLMIIAHVLALTFF